MILPAASRGFASLRPVAEAWAWIDRHAAPLPRQSVGWTDAEGRILASDVTATAQSPALPSALRDGYALRAADTLGADTYNPLPLSVVGTAAPGAPYAGTLAGHCAVHIAAGAALPAGADAVLSLEQSDQTGDSVDVTTPVAPGEHVRPAGADLRPGGPIFASGHRLTLVDAALLASAGIMRVDVHRSPSVRIVTVGSELGGPGPAPAGPQTLDIDGAVLARLVLRDGGEPEPVRRAGDDTEIRAALTVPGADVILVAGGSGAGFNDRAAAVLASVGTLAFHGVALNPARSAGIGTLGERLVFLLPGSPAACLLAYEFFAGRAIRRMAGGSGEWPYPAREAVTSRKIVSALGRVDVVPVRRANGTIEPVTSGDPLSLASLARGDGFVVVPAECEGYGAETAVTIHLYRPERRRTP